MATAKQKETLADTQATVLHQDTEHTVYHLDDADGEVVQTVYPVFPGIEIAYHDVHATFCAMQRSADSKPFRLFTPATAINERPVRQ